MYLFIDLYIFFEKNHCVVYYLRQKEVMFSVVKVCLSVYPDYLQSRIIYKVMNEFAWNFY